MIKYDIDTIRYMNFFEKVTSVKAKDAFLSGGGTLVFMAQLDKIGLAIGKAGINLRELASRLNKPIKIVGFSGEPLETVKSFLFPIQLDQISVEDGNISIKFKTTKHRRDLLADKQFKLRMLEELMRRYFPDIKGIKVL